MDGFYLKDGKCNPCKDFNLNCVLCDPEGCLDCTGQLIPSADRQIC